MRCLESDSVRGSQVARDVCEKVRRINTNSRHPLNKQLLKHLQSLVQANDCKYNRLTVKEKMVALAHMVKKVGTLVCVCCPRPVLYALRVASSGVVVPPRQDMR